MVQVSATSSCTTKGHPVVLSSEKGLNFEDNAVTPLYGCHICPPWNFSEGIIYQKVLQEKQMLDIIISVRLLSSFTHTSSESKKIYMAKDSILKVLCLCTSLFRIEQRMQAYQ